MNWWCHDLIYKKQSSRTYLIHNMRDATDTKKRAGITFLLEVDPAEIKNHR